MSAEKNSTEQQAQDFAQQSAGSKRIASKIKRKRPKKPNGHWLVEDNVRSEACKYNTKTEMKVANNPAYVGMCKLRLSDELFPNSTKKSNGYWTVTRCFDAAKRYEDLASFQSGKDKAAYTKLCRLKMIMEATSHMERRKVSNNHWTYENCKKEALNYRARNAFRINANGCYDKALKMGWLEDIASHMTSGYKSSDTVYVWKVLGFSDLYKFGISNHIWCRDRINIVAVCNEFDVEFGFMFKMDPESAYKKERCLLGIGDSADIPKNDGYTEFRHVCQHEMEIELEKLKLECSYYAEY